MNPMMLILAMSTGQNPVSPPAAPGYEYPVIRSQAVDSVPAVLPGTVPVIPIPGQGAIQQPMPMDVAKPSGIGNCEPEPPAAPVYFLERALKDSWIGQTMACRNLKLYGWTAMSYTVGTNSVSNLPMTFNNQPNHFQMNQNWLHFEKSIDTSKSERQWGFVTDTILPGTDARFSIPRGLFNGQPREYQFDLYQAYAQAFLPNLGCKGTTVKAGRFATLRNYEAVQAVDTPFVSKSYLYQYNPFTHTGVFATTQLNDTWSVGNGVALGSDNFVDPASRFTYLGQIRWARPEGKTTALFNAVITDPSFDVGEAFAFYNIYEAQVIHEFTDKFTFVVDAAFSHMDNVPGVGSSNWYGAANYFIYKWCDKLTSTLRVELFDDSQGVRTGFTGLYTEVTAGLAWSPKPGLIVRPSVRYDTNASSAPFEGSSNMWTAAFEMIVRW